MCSGGGTRALPRVGFPIRRSPDQRLVSSSPGLIAAAHVLHRLLAPRHPPCALVLLIRREPVFHRYGVFKVRAGRRPQQIDCLTQSLKTQQCSRRRGRRSSRRAPWCDADGAPESTGPRREDGAGRRWDGLRWCKRHRIPRKEVIQPQLPLRLPCYDFTPIINPTFDGSLPCGLGHRLRVLPTFVV